MFSARYLGLLMVMKIVHDGHSRQDSAGILFSNNRKVSFGLNGIHSQ
jgi:hypothetical protein